MHSLAFAQDIVNVAASEAKKYNLGRITKINILLGDGLADHEDSLKFSFGLLSKGTVAENAEIAVKIKPNDFGMKIENMEGE